ncbi:MAG: lipopolysaccharide biosynthesis protein [Massiliimalia sp.]|jgi:O-antigen/teichoic acid export membrane protein
MKLKDKILKDTSHLGKKTYVWTILSGTAYAATTFVLTWLVTIVLGKEGADPFNFAYTTGQLFLTLGFYGMRVFQASDLKQIYSFEDYWASRIISCGLMMAASVGFILINGYDWEKALLIFLVCAYRGFDAVSDVFEALYQQNGRMDISGRSSFYKIGASTLGFVAVFLVTKSPLWATFAALVITIGVWLWFDLPVCRHFAVLGLPKSTGSLKSLMIACLPLCLGNFLCNYIYSASKFAIDQQNLAQGYQTIFTTLFMPASVINLFSGFVFKPMVTSLATSWEEKRYKHFNRTLIRLSFLVLGLTVVAVAGAYFLGIPILSFVYHTDLRDYRLHLLIMIVGGGFSALSTVYYYVGTIMRRQKYVMGIYAVVAAVALLLSNPMVRRWELMGASLAYSLLMLLMTVLFLLLWAAETKKAYAVLKKEREEANADPME